jgi:hypothetical protein
MCDAAHGTQEDRVHRLPDVARLERLLALPVRDLSNGTGVGEDDPMAEPCRIAADPAIEEVMQGRNDGVVIGWRRVADRARDGNGRDHGQNRQAHQNPPHSPHAGTVLTVACVMRHFSPLKGSVFGTSPKRWNAHSGTSASHAKGVSGSRPLSDRAER